MLLGLGNHCFQIASREEGPPARGIFPSPKIGDGGGLTALASLSEASLGSLLKVCSGKKLERPEVFVKGGRDILVRRLLTPSGGTCHYKLLELQKQRSIIHSEFLFRSISD